MRLRTLVGFVAASALLGTTATALAAPGPAAKYLKVLPTAHTAVWTMMAGLGTTNGGENFDGFFKGQMTVSVPLGWTIKIPFKNVGDLPHSLVVEPWGENYNTPQPKAAFPGAETKLAVDGTAPGSGQTLTFKALKPGKYRVVCAVPGHAALGMWDTLIVQKGLATAVWGLPSAAHHAPAPKAKPKKKAPVKRPVKHKATPAAKQIVTKWLTSIPARHQAVLKLMAGLGTNNGGENFDGYFKGQMTVTVPQGWSLSVNFKNVGDLPHSAVLEPYGESYNSPQPKPAYPGAQTPIPVDGTAPGSSAHFAAKLTRPGKYRIVCAVPGHAALGMWMVVLVKPHIAEASVHV